MECEEGLKFLYEVDTGQSGWLGWVDREGLGGRRRTGPPQWGGPGRDGHGGGGHGPVQQEGLGPDGRPGGLWGKEKLLTSRRGDFIYRMLYRMFLFSLLGKFCHFSGCAGKGADKTKVLSKKSIGLFTCKQRHLSIDMKTKVVQHVKSE